MAVECDASKCLACAGCVSVCPKQALTLDEGRIHCHADKCIDCGACIKVCPAKALSKASGK